MLTITDETGDVTVDLSSLSDALNDTTVSNTAATFDGATNVLTITDETGDVAVDISAVDTDTTDLDWAVSGTASDLSTGIGDNIYTNGNVGINTDAPLYPLVVDTAATQTLWWFVKQPKAQRPWAVWALERTRRATRWT